MEPRPNHAKTWSSINRRYADPVETEEFDGFDAFSPEPAPVGARNYGSSRNYGTPNVQQYGAASREPEQRKAASPPALRRFPSAKQEADRGADLHSQLFKLWQDADLSNVKRADGKLEKSELYFR